MVQFRPWPPLNQGLKRSGRSRAVKYDYSRGIFADCCAPAARCCRAACRSSRLLRSCLVRGLRRYQVEAHRVRGQNKAVFQVGAGLGLVGELIVACHDEQAISRLQLHYLQRRDALDGSLLVTEGGEEILKAQWTVVARAEHRAQLFMASALLCPIPCKQIVLADT